MDAPLRWIKQYCDIDTTPAEFASKMTIAGQKVERYWSYADEIKNVVVGKITHIEKHPDSDHLQICSVDIGTKKLVIVTGAANVNEGDVVPVALDGSTLPGGKEIHTGELRGVVSEGMMCSIGELGMTIHDFPECIENGIMILPADTPLGEDICKVTGLDDTVVEFEITPNRPDCLCVSGLAREAAVAYGVPFNFPSPPANDADGDVTELVSVSKETPNCMRYMAAAVKNVRVKPSPMWMRERLRGCGVRPINNIVDITNYVMLEYNQPMHSFDERNIAGGKIVIRQAREGEGIMTLDGTERKLNPSMMVIADAEKPIAVAGVMGGEFSGITDDTNTVIFESACFDGQTVRSAAKALGMRTDASSRYEKGLDPNNTEPALLRALELVKLLDAGDVIGGIIDIKDEIKPMPILTLEPDRINDFLGIKVDTEFMVKTLRDLEFAVDDKLNVTPPTFRGDIACMNDLAEEVARFYGYNNIPNTLMSGVATARPTERQRFERELKDICTSAGLFEIETLPFMGKKQLDALRIADDSYLRSATIISNPLGEDTSMMRTTMLPSMLDTLARNYSLRNTNVALFELSIVFLQGGDNTKLPEERKHLVIGSYDALDFYKLKGIIEDICRYSAIDNAEFSRLTDDPTYHPGRAALVSANGVEFARMGELYPTVSESYGIKSRVYVADIDIEKLFELKGEEKKFVSLPRFPAVTRDLALVCDLDTESGSIEKVIKNACGDLLENIKVFDVYVGAGVEKGKKSIAYSLVLRDREKTLTDDVVDSAVTRALNELAALGIKLRG